MKLLKASFLTLFAVAFLAGTSLAKTVTVAVDDYSVKRVFDRTELVDNGSGDYEVK